MIGHTLATVLSTIAADPRVWTLLPVYARGREANSAGEIADPTSNVEKSAQQCGRRMRTKGKPRLLGDMGCNRGFPYERGSAFVAGSLVGQY